MPNQTDPHHAVWTLLESVCDPEIPVVSLREMGVLRAISADAQGLAVVITPTYSGCPAMSQIHDDVVLALKGSGIDGRVVAKLSPAWSSDWITAEGKAKLKAYGIAPPHACASEAGSQVVFMNKHLMAQSAVVQCPQCESFNTTETSRFGSTACKAMFRCLDCSEPFDYFKPY